MKHTKQNIIKLLEVMRDHAYDEYLKYIKNTESAYISLSKAEAYAIALRLIDSKEYFEMYVKEYLEKETYFGE